jgi:membrane protein DedA with SNARE-associated domain
VAAIFMAAVGNTLACVVEYYVGGSIGELADFEKRKQKLPFRLGNLPIHSPVFLLVARLIPGLGGKTVSIASGVYKVPLGKYLWTTTLANLVGAAFLALGGTGLLALLK